MVGRLEKTIPLSAGCLVAGMIGLAVVDPPKPDTARPVAVLAPTQMEATFETAAGADIAVPPGLLRVNAPGAVIESVLGPVDVSRRGYGGRVRSLHTTDALHDTFKRMDYELDAVTEQGRPVPRVFLASLPTDLGDVREPEKRKDVFFRTVLPLVLQVNEEIQAERQRLWRLHEQIKRGHKVAAVDRLWLIVLADRYKVERGDMEALLRRVDIVPPSLALAQAAEESGWGTSRFSRLGNAIFGEYTFDDAESLVPQARADGKRHRIRAFKSLLHSVRAYANNLNTHRAYKDFRQRRSQLRLEGLPIRGRKLVDTLERYSERGQAYLKNLRAIMAVNKLGRLDEAQLSRGMRNGREAPAI
ncbi:MAG: glucosaminidase domain-containing protein [Rhodospirillaceae bacterium]